MSLIIKIIWEVMGVELPIIFLPFTARTARLASVTLLAAPQREME